MDCPGRCRIVLNRHTRSLGRTPDRHGHFIHALGDTDRCGPGRATPAQGHGVVDRVDDDHLRLGDLGDHLRGCNRLGPEPALLLHLRIAFRLACLVGQLFPGHPISASKVKELPDRVDSPQTDRNRQGKRQEPGRKVCHDHRRGAGIGPCRAEDQGQALAQEETEADGIEHKFDEALGELEQARATELVPRICDRRNTG